jgi:hypothetical protein
LLQSGLESDAGYVKVSAPRDHRLQIRRHKKVGELGSDIGVIRYALTPSYRKPRSSLPKKVPFSQEMHLKIPLLGRGLKISISKPGLRVSALHFFVT